MNVGTSIRAANLRIADDDAKYVVFKAKIGLRKAKGSESGAA